MHTWLLNFVFTLVLFGSVTSVAAMDTCNKFSFVSVENSSASDAAAKARLLSERALQIAELIFSRQSLITNESIKALQKYSAEYQNLVSELNTPTGAVENSVPSINARIENDQVLRRFIKGRPVTLIRTLTSTANRSIEDSNQRGINFVLISLLVEDVQNLRRVEMTRARAIYLLTQASILIDIWWSEEQSDLLAMHDTLRDLLDRADNKAPSR